MLGGSFEIELFCGIFSELSGSLDSFLLTLDKYSYKPMETIFPHFNLICISNSIAKRFFIIGLEVI
jgi:hypothetical protein